MRLQNATGFRATKLKRQQDLRESVSKKERRVSKLIDECTSNREPQEKQVTAGASHLARPKEPSSPTVNTNPHTKTQTLVSKCC